MPSQKRALENKDGHQRKKAKITKDSEPAAEKGESTISNVISGEVDFPRGGGTSLTPVEYKKVRSEALKELKDEIFKARLLSNKSHFLVFTLRPGERETC